MCSGDARVRLKNERVPFRWLLLCVFGVLTQPLFAQSEGAASRPSFLLITTDDMGYTDLGAFGGFDIPTPHLDSLARTGVRFSNFHATPSCAPTRASLMTGTGNTEAGLGTQLEYEGLQGWGYERYLQDRVATLPELLAGGGYQTILSGKWHITSSDPDGSVPRDHGFQRDFSLLQGADSHVQTVFQRRSEYSLDGERIQNPLAGSYSTTRYVDELIGFLQDYLDSGSQEPFFVWFAPTAPHWPLQYPPGWQGVFDGAYDEGFDVLCLRRMAGASAEGVLPEYVDIESCNKEEQAWSELNNRQRQTYLATMEVYAAMTAHLDQEVGRLLNFMREHGLLDDTWVIYHNDNGPQGGGTGARSMGDMNSDLVDNSPENIGQPDSWANLGQGWADAISSPFRDGKASQYEGGVRVAAFAWHADYHNPGEVDPQYLHVMDIAPTLLDFAGVYPPVGSWQGRDILPMRGVTFVPSLTGSPQPARDNNDAVILSAAGKHYVARGDWKLVFHDGPGWQLFNLADDPEERNDLSGTQPEVFDQLMLEFRQSANELNYRERL